MAQPGACPSCGRRFTRSECLSATQCPGCQGALKKMEAGWVGTIAGFAIAFISLVAGFVAVWLVGWLLLIAMGIWMLPGSGAVLFLWVFLLGTLVFVGVAGGVGYGLNYLSAPWITRHVPADHPRCSTCDYDLRGLTGSTCPECGQPLPLPPKFDAP